jgi:NADH-quinone oxidoreductase subunit G
VIYQGSHGDRGAHRADIILPARPIPRSRACSSTPKAARNWRCARLPARRGAENWAILRALSGRWVRRCPGTIWPVLAGRCRWRRIRIWPNYLTNPSPAN